MNVFPRTLLLTSWNPDGRYAGAEAMRRLLRALPRERILWCSLKAAAVPLADGMPEHRSCVAPAVHWRLRNSVVGYVWDFDIMARRLARQVAEACAAFRPELIWVLPELRAIPVGFLVAERLRLPLHATVYDAPESAGDICVPGGYYRRYMRHAQRFFRRLDSADAVSDGLLDHVRALAGGDLPGMVAPPCIPRSWMRESGASYAAGDRTRRIGFCGSFRVVEDQWKTWLRLLSRLPWDMELVAFASPDTVPAVELPRNVRWRFHAYVDDERSIVEAFVSERVHACYLGLRRADCWGLFNRTSLSSKLVTYSAAGLPVIVDAPRDSVAWEMVSRYGAGVRLDSDDTAAIGGLKNLLGDPGKWRACAEGSARMCGAEFDLEDCAGRLTELMCATAERGHQ